MKLDPILDTFTTGDEWIKYASGQLTTWMAHDDLAVHIQPNFIHATAKCLEFMGRRYARNMSSSLLEMQQHYDSIISEIEGFEFPGLTVEDVEDLDIEGQLVDLRAMRDASYRARRHVRYYTRRLQRLKVS